MAVRWPTPDQESRSVLVLRTRFCETDLMGVIHHATYLTYFEMARVEYLRRRGTDYQTWISRGYHLAVAESHTRHRRPLRFDDRIRIEASLAELGRASAQFSYRLVKEVDPDTVVAEGKTLLACVGNDGEIRMIPEELALLLCGPERHPRPIDTA